MAPYSVSGPGQQQLQQQERSPERHHTPADSDISLEGLAIVKAVTIRRDDELGLGFNITQSEEGGKRIVRVKSIKAEGPADKVGHLSVLDLHIIHVHVVVCV